MIYKKTITFLQELLEEDIVIYIGEGIIRFLSEKTRNAYSSLLVMDTELDFISVATGMALTTNKKVTLVCDDNYIFKYYSSLLQAAASKCHNLFFVMIVTKNYSGDMQQTNLFNSVASVKGSIFEMGFLTHIHTRFFKNKKMFNKLKDAYGRFVGPAMGIIEVHNSKYEYVKPVVDNDVNTFIDFVRYQPIKELDEKEDTTTLVIKEN